VSDNVMEMNPDSYHHKNLPECAQ